MREDIKELLERTGFDKDAVYDLPKDGTALSKASIQKFMNRMGIIKDEPNPWNESTGILHISGNAVTGHCIPIAILGRLITNLQEWLNYIGASLEGNISASGRLPHDIIEKTEMSLIASPMPGSVVLQVAPSDRCNTSSCQEPLFELEDIEESRLIDSTIKELTSLIDEMPLNDNYQNEFIEHLIALGPRTAKSMAKICDLITESDLKVDFAWGRPDNYEIFSQIDRHKAQCTSRIIKDADIESEESEITGVIITITESKKDKLRVCESETGEEVTISLGMIDPRGLSSIKIGDRVKIKVIKTVSNTFSKSRTPRFEGISISVLS